jgi:hypothetical protein
MKLSSRWRKALLTLHIATAGGWLGSDLVLLTFGVAGLAGRDPAVVYPAAALVGTFVFAPLSLAVWLIGVGSALLSPWRLLRHWWVVTKLTLVTVMVVLVFLALLPGLQDAGTLGAALPSRDRINLVVAPSVSTTLLVTATILSTYKPWGRTRRPRRATSPAVGMDRVGERVREPAA